MKILVLGAGGQVGNALLEKADAPGFPIGWTLMGWTRAEGDLSQSATLIEKLKNLKPDCVINAAAYTQVDRAESEKDLCYEINAKTPQKIAEYCKSASIPLVHYSSDYVYSGSGESPHTEEENYSPPNIYGNSKADGDRFITESGADHLIFRTSWVYSHQGKNFVNTMQRLALEKPELKVVNDQFGSPTYAPDLAEYSLNALMLAIEAKTMGGHFPSGVYHLTNSGVITWAGFAQAILPGMKITGIPSSAYPTPAKRPLNSRLSLEKLKRVFNISPATWQDALTRCLKRMESNHG